MSIDFDALFPDARQVRRPDRRVARVWIILLLALALLMGMRLLVGVYIDALWFGSLGQGAVFRTELLAPVAVFGATALAGALWLGAHGLWALRRGAVRGARSLVLLAACGMAGVVALGAAAEWQRLLLYRHGGAFGLTEPVLGRDVGFYVFQLPVWQLGQALAASLVVAALVGSAVVYVLSGAVELGGALRRAAGKGPFAARLKVASGTAGPARGARRHLLLLGAVYAAVLALGSWLDRFALLNANRSDAVFAGPGYADVTLRLPVYGVLAWLWLAVALLLVFSAFAGRLRLAIGFAAAVLTVRVLAADVYPGIVQQYRVKPNELAYERPYLTHGIEMTRKAWGLDAIESVDYEPQSRVSAELLASHRGSLDNVRLWDWQVLLDYFEQKQSIRPYYDFRDVDIDRYTTKEGLRQVELAARELQPAGLRNPTWISRHLEYTHGYGLAMVPVDRVDARGQPVLWVRDLPLRSIAPFQPEITQPRIYFGEGGGDDVPYVIVKTRTDEFDYPLGAENARTVYDGADGVQVGSSLRRMAFALYFGDYEILLSNDVTAQSEVLMRRVVAERVQRLAPFLTLDADPYLVVSAEGRLVWMIDAYTSSDRFPYAAALRLPASSGGSVANYMRNSVKVVVDAYDGTPSFYVVAPDDPIIRAWQQVFPSLLQPAEAMPEGLRAHWRYPEALFTAQARVFERYHVTRPDVFYNGEDLWTVPQETRGQGSAVPMDPYYVTMRLRGEADPEFLLMRPFTPAGKKNMNAWLAARADPEHYGHLVLYNFGKGQQIDGPEQIESRIDNNTDISAQLTLWSQAGSRTIRGNLLVIPLDDALLYVEPLFLQAETNALPELKRVIVADGERVEMRETFAAALAALVDARLERAGVPDSGDTAIPGRPLPEDAEAAALPTDVTALVTTARSAQTAAGKALETGDWRGFGVEMDRLSRALERLGELTGEPTPDNSQGTSDALPTPTTTLGRP